MKDLLESDPKTFPLSFTVSHNSVEDDYLRSNIAHKLSVLPPPPLLIRPTPITQSRDSLVLNTEGKFWNQGDHKFHTLYMPMI